MSTENPYAAWLRDIQGIDLSGRQTISAQRSDKSVGDILDEAGGGTVFDTEPARYYQLLKKLAPSTGKND